MMNIDGPTLFDWNWPEGLRFIVMKLQHETPPQIAHLPEKLVVCFLYKSDLNRLLLSGHRTRCDVNRQGL